MNNLICTKRQQRMMQIASPAIDFFLVQGLSATARGSKNWTMSIAERRASKETPQ
ncbi:hypothetical protein [Bradyrhizobium sp. AZCC 2289]|uniref:hypothetical protein n=1 Tax=Bradyrhizobium sp. AZCC 2289 TaxID=3117026 RepID=UPI002FF16D4F